MGKYLQYDKDRLEEIVKEEREKNEKKIMLTWGCFDLITRGHIYYLNKVNEIKKENGGVLFVNVANDKRVEYRKGEGRPVITAYKRALVLSKLETVDYVIIHPEEKSSPAFQLASIIKPDIMVQSWSWDEESKKALEKLLGKKQYDLTKLIRMKDQLSDPHTTDIIGTIKENVINELYSKLKETYKSDDEYREVIEGIFSELKKESNL